MPTVDYRLQPAHYLCRPDCFIPAAVAVVYNEYRSTCLFVKSRHNGKWMLPSATMLPGESAEETAKRAVLERTGLVADQAEPFIADSGKYVRAVGQPRAQLIRFGFRINRWSGELATKTAHTVDARWVAEEEMYASLSRRGEVSDDISNLSEDDWCIYEDHRSTLECEVPAEGNLVWMR